MTYFATILWAIKKLFKSGLSSASRMEEEGLSDLILPAFVGDLGIFLFYQLLNIEYNFISSVFIFFYFVK